MAEADRRIYEPESCTVSYLKTGLREDEEGLFRAVFNQTFQYIAVLDADGRVREINRPALDGIGVDEQAVIGRLFWETPWWSLSARMQRELKRCIRNAALGRRETMNVVHLDRDGAQRDFEVTIKPLEGPQGHSDYLLVEGHDVTQRRLVEEELQRTLDQLEMRIEERTVALQDQIVEREKAEGLLQKAQDELKRLVDERTRDLQVQIAEKDRIERQFIQAQKMEAVGQLTGGISHDFNNLLTIILGNLDWLRERLTDDEKSAHLAEEAMKAAQRGADLTQRLLTFSRKQDLWPECVDLPDLIGRFEPLLERALREAVSVEKDFEDELWTVFVDPGQLENAIMNLGINSRDAMPAGGTLTIKAGNFHAGTRFVSGRPGLAAGDYVRLTVEDTGTGMSPEILQRACDPFFTTKETGRGSGLGLSMVFGFARQSGGFVDMDSELGRGTSIHLYLPRAKRVEPALRESRRPGHRIVGGSEGVLVVEDDPLVRELVLGYLEDLGYNASTAETGVDALDFLTCDARDIDLVLTDIVMPGGMSGIDLGEAVAAKYSDIKVVHMSGYSHDDFSNDEKPLDEMTMLRKPFTKEELAGMIRRVLDS